MLRNATHEVCRVVCDSARTQGGQKVQIACFSLYTGAPPLGHEAGASTWVVPGYARQDKSWTAVVPGYARAREGQKALFFASILPETNFFEKNVRFELDFSGMSARLNNMPDAGVAQW